jgi:hypothetical protein
MEYISTTSLAHEYDVSANEMFTRLKSIGWIERANDKWILTDLGNKKGGKMKKDPKFGEYIVWPEDISLEENGNQGASGKLLNSTAIGKHFGVSSQRINLILSELGFVENDVAGWQVTVVGKNFGGLQRKHEQSGKFFVLWPPNILENKNLTEVFRPPQKIEAAKLEVEKAATPSESTNFRHKYPANWRTQDGHFVRSKAEVIIDDFLYHYGLVHTYEKKLPVIGDDMICDFYIPPGTGRPQAVYIEFWGMEKDPKYQERMKAKIAVYEKYQLRLIQLTDADLQNLDDVLTRKLLEFKVGV